MMADPTRVSAFITNHCRMTRAENPGDFLEGAASKCGKPVGVKELFLYLLKGGHGVSHNLLSYTDVVVDISEIALISMSMLDVVISTAPDPSATVSS